MNIVEIGQLLLIALVVLVGIFALIKVIFFDKKD
jgi:hypothetical protein